MVEQQCLFQDMDGADDQAMHLLGVRGGELLGYARCFSAGVKFAEASFGRVVTRQSVRGTSLGHALIEQAVTAIHQLWGPQPIRIGAQTHLADFYAKHGFKDVGSGRNTAYRILRVSWLRPVFLVFSLQPYWEGRA